MRGADGCRWYAVPFRIEPARGQVPEYPVKSSRKESCDVLHKDASGSKVANGEGEVDPEAATASFNDAAPKAGEAEVLTGEASDDDVDGSVVTFERLPVHFGDVAKVDGVGESSGHDAARIGVDFAVGDEFAIQCLERDVEPADP